MQLHAVKLKQNSKSFYIRMEFTFGTAENTNPPTPYNLYVLIEKQFHDELIRVDRVHK